MKPARLLPSLGGIRLHMTVLLMAAVLVAGVGYEALLVTLTRHTEEQELESRARSLARLLAERSSTPVVVNDVGELDQQVVRATAEPDIVGAAIYPVRGGALAERARNAGLWTVLGPFRGRAEPHDVLIVRRRAAGGDVFDAVVPIFRAAGPAGALDEATQVFGFADAAPTGAGSHVGWVRLVVSTQRARLAAQNAARLGLLLLLASAVLGLFAVSIYVGFIVRPLREARDLARDIASGQLDRRLPVRGADELGDLAGSMNTMAGALKEARRVAESEAGALRTASAAMLSIAQGARAAHDPRSVFQMVAREVRSVTRCRAVALAIPPAERDLPTFEHFEPGLPWGGLSQGLPFPPALLERVRAAGDCTLRLAADAEYPLFAGLARDGFRAALAVALHLPGAPPAVLLAASEDPHGFAPAERDVVIALTSHLSSALHAARLQDQLQQTLEELQRTHDCLVQSEMLRVAGEMASGVAHDFNNVLGAILGRTQLLARRLETGALSTEDLASSLAVIEQAAQDGRETGRRLRQFGQSSPRAAEPVDMHGVLTDAVEFTRTRWENEAQAAGVTVQVHLDADPGLWVAGRASELREVFTNLVLNSIDALPQGGTIRLAAHARGDHIHASVADDGIGMDDETSRRLFEPFFTTKGENGTGLGLSVVYGIVQRHGGTIEVVSRPGRGTRMELSFPRTVAPETRPEAETNLQGLPVLDVMIVDDEAPVRDVLRDIAETFGQRVTACPSGEEALRAFRPGAFQLVMTDLGMPGMTGWDLARRLRDLDLDVTIVFVTGWGENVDTGAAGHAGVDLVLAKPFNLEDVARTIRLAARPRERQAA